MTSTHGRTPMYGSQTPMYGTGSRTPMYGSQTPLHDGERDTPPRKYLYGPQSEYISMTCNITILIVVILVPHREPYTSLRLADPAA